MAIKNNRNFCACGIYYTKTMGKPKYRCGKSNCNTYGLNK